MKTAPNKGLLFTGRILKGPEFPNASSVVLYDQPV